MSKDNINEVIERLEYHISLGGMFQQPRVVVDDVVSLIATVRDFQTNLGDIVTYGTTADVLDTKLQEAYKRIKELEDAKAK